MKTLSLALILFVMLGWSGAAVAEETITLRPASDITGRAIKLGDVFMGVADDKNVDIAIAPEPSKSVTYDARVLTKLAATHHLAWQPQSIADKIVLTRAATHITPDMIVAAVLNKLRETNKDVAPSTEIVLDNRTLSVALPSDQAPDFDLAQFSYMPSSRRFQAEMLIKSETQPIAKAITGRVLIKRSVPVLSRPLVAGTVVGERDLAWLDMKEEQIVADIISNPESIVGMELRHDQNEGSTFRMRDLAQPRLVQRGGLVTLKVETPLMQITAQGRSLQDGAKGDVVRVTNVQSKRIVEGVVEADGVVRVNALQQKLALADH